MHFFFFFFFFYSSGHTNEYHSQCAYFANRVSHAWWDKNKFTWSAGLEITACWERTTPESSQRSPVFAELMILNGKMMCAFIQQLLSWESNCWEGSCLSHCLLKESFITVCSLPDATHVEVLYNGSVASVIFESLLTVMPWLVLFSPWYSEPCLMLCILCIDWGNISVHILQY